MKRRFASLDDETESETDFQSLIVSNYHLEDNNDEPAPFSVLPIQWNDSEVSNVNDAKKEQIFLHGFADNGLQKIFLQVTAWKFDISGLKPEILLLSKDRGWIKLQKPRKSFQDTVKTVLITLYFLHCVKKKPRLSTASFWSNLCKDRDLSSYGFKPSQKDLLDHMALIGEATKRDAVLARSKLLLTVLGDNPEDQKPSDEELEDFDNDIIDEADEDSIEDNLFDSVCALCDNGGRLLMCDGECMRSFHGTKADGRESFCDSLGFSQKEFNDIETFYCKNCEYRQHQCFACGELGSSDKDKGAEVFKCASENCDRFYHPHCVAKLLPESVIHVAEDLEKNIADGKPFNCSIHFCCVCKGLENKMEPELQFAVCNRCPKSYHRKCLPTGIYFDDIDGINIRAWEGLLPNNRILIYCLNHEISDKLGTPVRDHIKFPDTRATVREINTSNKKMKPTTKERVILENNVGVVKSSSKSTAKGSKVNRKRPSRKIGSKKSSEKIISGSDISKTPESKEMSSRSLMEDKKSISKNLTDKVISCSDISRKPGSNKISCLTENKKSISKLSGKTISGSDISRKPKSNEISRKLLTENKKSISKKLEMPNCEENKRQSGQKLCAPMNEGSENINHDNQVDDAVNKTHSIKPIRSVVHPMDADSEKGLVDSFKEARSSILLEGVMEKHKLGDVEDKAITTGKVDDSVYSTTQHSGDAHSDKSNHDLLESTDDQEKQTSTNESQKRSSHDGNIDQESQKGQGFKMNKSWKTSGKRKRNEKGDRRGLGVSSQSFQEKDVVSSQAKKQPVKRGPDNQEISHCGTKLLSDCGVKNADENQSREEKNHRRESDVRQQVGLSVVQNPNSTQKDHAQLSPASADESNTVRMGSLCPETPIFSGHDTSECIVPPGFASGPNYAYSLHHSAGWLDE